MRGPRREKHVAKQLRREADPHVCLPHSSSFVNFGNWKGSFCSVFWNPLQCCTFESFSFWGGGVPLKQATRRKFVLGRAICSQFPTSPSWKLLLSLAGVWISGSKHEGVISASHERKLGRVIPLSTRSR